MNTDRIGEKAKTNWVLRRVDRSSGKPRVVETSINQFPDADDSYSPLVLSLLRSINGNISDLALSDTSSIGQVRMRHLMTQAAVLRGIKKQLVEFTLSEDKEVVGIKIHPTNDIKEIR